MRTRQTKTPKRIEPKVTRNRRGMPMIAGPNLTPEQRIVIFAELEDMMFVEGFHKDKAIERICEKYKCDYKTGHSWVSKMLKKWRESIDKEELPERHYQLDRMAHNLYTAAMSGMSWGKAKESLDKVIKHIEKGETALAVALLETMKTSKVPDLRVAQRVLWTLCAVSGYGNKITVDVTGAGAVKA